MFGAAGGIDDPRKGFDLLVTAIRQAKLKNIKIVVFGNRDLNYLYEDLDIFNVGEIRVNSDLRMLYSACDIFALTSRLDNLPLTGMEALSCGLPMVGFKKSGIVDLIDHNITGWLANPFSTVHLGEGIAKLFNNKELLEQLSENSILKSKKEFNENLISERYSQIYNNINKLV